MGKSSRIVLVDGTPFFRKMDGVARYSVSLISKLSEDLPLVTFRIVCFFDDQVDHSLLPARDNITYLRLPIPRKIYSGIYSRIVRLPIDIFLPKNFTYMISTNFTIFPYVKSARHINFIHDMAFLDVPESLEKKNLSHLTKNVRWSLKKTSYTAVISRFTQSRLVQHYKSVPSEKLLLVYPRALFKQLSPEPITNEHEEHILTVGTFEPRKNIEALVKAYSLIPQDIQEKHPLVIAGGRGWGDSKKLTSQNEHIIVIERPSDEQLEELYRKARLFIFPSKYEGFGLPVLEALQHRTAVLSNDIPSVREFAADSINYFTTQSTKGWSREIIAAMRSPKNSNFHPTVKDDYAQIVTLLSEE